MTTLVRPKPLFDFRYLEAACAAMKERNDCAVKAVCVVTDEPYPKIHEMFRQMGRRKRCGTHDHITRAVLAKCGYKLQDVTISFPQRTIRSVGPTLSINDKFLLSCSKHVAGAVGGVVYDWSEQRGLYVQHVYKLVRREDEMPQIQIPPTDHQAGRWRGGRPASAIIWDLAEKELEDTLRETGFLNPVAPRSRRFWLALRARVMAKAEAQNIKRTTSSIELGKWQREKGYPMEDML